MLKASPIGGVGAPHIPNQFVSAIELVLTWPRHRHVQALKQAGICTSREKAGGAPFSFKLNAGFSGKGARIL